ncbi:hypothetical protein JCM6882_004264 [Rhodosporidiobolus microsporus]
MSSSKRPRSASMDSHEFANDSQDDVEPPAGASEGPASNGAGGGKKGKSKAAKEADRKAQNRIAQREFRQRKQQYVKELEAKVALHEMGRDEQVERMVNALKLLLEENQQLRTLLGHLSGFIGEGIGSCLPRIGLELPEFKELLARTPFENATDALKLPVGAKPAGFSSTAVPATAAPVASTSARTLDSLPASLPQSQPSLSTYNVSSFAPAISSPTVAFPTAAPVSTPHSQPGSVAIPQPDITQFALPPAPTAAVGTYDYYTQQYNSYSEPRAPQPAPRPPLQQQQPSRQSSGSSTLPATEEETAARFVSSLKRGNMDEIDSISREMVDMPTDNAQMEAIQLIGYHMRNKRENPNYHLPPSLRMSTVQQTVPHPPFLDGIIFSSLRDRLILLKDNLSVDELVGDLALTLRIHRDDVLTPEAWELDEKFLKKYWYVIDQEVLDISNRWRAERGEPPLSMRCIVPSNSSGTGEGGDAGEESPGSGGGGENGEGEKASGEGGGGGRLFDPPLRPGEMAMPLGAY